MPYLTFIPLLNQSSLVVPQHFLKNDKLELVRVKMEGDQNDPYVRTVYDYEEYGTTTFSVPVEFCFAEKDNGVFLDAIDGTILVGNQQSKQVLHRLEESNILSLVKSKPLMAMCAAPVYCISEYPCIFQDAYHTCNKRDSHSLQTQDEFFVQSNLVVDYRAKKITMTKEVLTALGLPHFIAMLEGRELQKEEFFEEMRKTKSIEKYSTIESDDDRLWKGPLMCVVHSNGRKDTYTENEFKELLQ